MTPRTKLRWHNALQEAFRYTVGILIVALLALIVGHLGKELTAPAIKPVIHIGR